MHEFGLRKKIFLSLNITGAVFLAFYNELTYGSICSPRSLIVAGIYAFVQALSLKPLLEGSDPFRYLERGLDVYQSKTLCVESNFDDVFESCISSLQQLAKCQIQRQDRTMGVIEAQTGMSWKSCGEKVLFIISKDGDNRCKLTVSSRPSVVTTLVDYGKNADNIKTIVDFFSNSILSHRYLEAPNER